MQIEKKIFSLVWYLNKKKILYSAVMQGVLFENEAAANHGVNEVRGWRQPLWLFPVFPSISVSTW